MIKLISVHIPKAAGTSFKYSLKSYYKFKYKSDYDTYYNHEESIKFNNSINYEDYKEIECIHGHFYPLKYLVLKNYDWKFITFLRNPVERLISNYYQIKRNANNLGEDLFAKEVINNNFSVEDYCLHPHIKNIYKSYLLYFEEKYDFIGIVENYKKDLNYLSNKYFQNKLKFYVSNVNPNKNYYNIYNIDNQLRKKIEIFHEEDICIYEKYLQLSNER